MKTYSLLLGFCVSLTAAAQATTETMGPAYSQAITCSVAGCRVSCPSKGGAPALEFKASALKLTLLPSRVAVFEATSGLGDKKTHLVDISERNCEIAQ